MKKPWPVVAALGAGLSLVGAGCSSTNACLDLACADSANVTLTALATQIAASLPATVTVCLGDACTAFRIDHTGAAPICTALSAGPGLCTIDGEGNVILTSLPLPRAPPPGPPSPSTPRRPTPSPSPSSTRRR